MPSSHGRKALTVTLASAVALAVSGAYAFHPGETRSGDVPQGPEWIACENPGWTGIEIAISVDGMVHCEDLGGGVDDGGGDDDGGDNGGVG